MRNTLLTLFLFSFFFACSPSPENKIMFVTLHTNLLRIDTDSPQLHIEQYVEYQLNKKELMIACSENGYDSILNWNWDSIPAFGLNKFFTYEYDESLKSQLNNLFTRESKKNIFAFQNSLFRNNPPPKLKGVIQFIPPKIENEDEN
ncbi:hypothetical protein LJC52_04445 [Bacteroidales bacterium OttesenSCG-928-A17]|nr:hypothetical protein [Bacteroidales bacterium OttesenSCG-928-A17]